MDNLKDKQFLQKLCNSQNNSSGTTSSSSSTTVCRPTIINTIKAKDSTNTQSSKLSSYVQRGKYMTIYEGKIKELTMIFATPSTATVVFIPVGYIKTITLIAQNRRNASDSHSSITLTSPYTFQNLTPNSAYDVTAIAAYSSGNKYTETFTNAIRTLNEGPPTNVRISKITNKTAFITFIKAIGVPSDVNITITNTNINDLNDQQYISNITTNEILISNLQINNTYTILMTSIYNITKNKYSIKFTFTTLNEDFPTDIIFTDVNNISATISYKYTGTPLYNSIIVVNNSNSGERYIQDTLQTTTTFQLNSNVTYNVTVESVYSSGNTFPVEKNNAFYILNEGPPNDINLQYIKGTSILFSFVNAIGNPFRYDLVLTDPLNNIINKIMDVNNTQNIFVEDLTPNIIYNFILKSSYLQTNNVYIYSTTFQTLNEGSIQNFELNSIGNSFITFSFTYPPGDNYNITVIMNNPLDYKTININTNQYTLNELLIGSKYTLSINTVYTKSNTTYTYRYPVIIETLLEGSSIIKSISNITNQTVSITFSNSYNIPDKYIFVNTNVIIPTNIITTEYQVSNSREGNIIITGLLPNSIYKTVLNTYYNLNTPSQNIYPKESILEIYTKGPPTKIQVNEYITDTQAFITFISPIVVPTKYILTTNHNTTLDISVNQINTVDNLSYYNISGLIPNAYYDISFGAYYKDINEVYTNSFTLITKGPVQNVFVTTITDTSATLVFNSPLLEYRWEYNVYIKDKYTNINDLNKTNTSFVFEDLSKNTAYTVYIEAIYNTNNITQNQKFFNNITFNTKSFPYNIFISDTDILDEQITLNWTTLLNTPTYYNITYYPPIIPITYQRLFKINSDDTGFIEDFMDDTSLGLIEGLIDYTVDDTRSTKITGNIQVNSSDVTTNNQTQISSYNIIGLTPDISYNIIEISAYYSDIDTNTNATTYTNVNVDLSAVFTKSPPTDISGYNQTNVSMTISFITPLNTKPTSYSIYVVDTTNNNNSKYISLNENPDYGKGTVITYEISDLSDNTNYNIFANSHYNDGTNTAPIIIESSPYNISTHGTPNILSFTHIYTDSFTINIKPLFVQPLNYIFTFYNIRFNKSTTTNGLFNSDGKFITPNTFFIKDTYNVTIQSVYSNNEIYTSNTKQVSTSSPPILLSYVSTDVSAIVYFIPPLNPPNSYNYTTSNTINPVTVNTFTNYFIVNDLSATSINNIILYSHYSDNNQNYGSDSIQIYTKGPPTALNIQKVFNTYINLSFTTAYQCSKYTINAIPIDNTKPSTLKISSQTSSQTLNTVNFILSGLFEDTSYNIFITSNYDNFNGNSTPVRIYTYKAIQIESITNITDVSAIIIVNTRPSILPTDISFSYKAGNITYGLDVDNSYNSITNSLYYIFKIDGLTPNTKYDPFTIQSYYMQENVTFVSENKPFSTKGITDISIYVTDISATISFPTPYISPSQYYYILNNNDTKIQFTPQNIRKNVTTGLIMYFPFNMDTIDSISSTNYLTNNTLLINNTIQKVGTGCLDVTKSSIYGTNLNITQLYNINNTLTFSFWINLSSVPSTNSNSRYWIFSNGTSILFSLSNANNFSTRSTSLYFQGRSDIRTNVQYTSILALSSNVTNYTNSWHHLVWIVNGSNWIVYVDGVQQTSVDVGRYSLGNQTQTTPYNTGFTINTTTFSTISFGGNQNTQSASCFLDDFRVYNKVLSISEINTLYRYNSEYTIPDLSTNTPYSKLTIQTEYSDISGIYISKQDISFCTKMIPVPTVIIGDTQIDVSFTAVKSPYVQGYSYSLDQYTYDIPDVPFTPIVDVNGMISLTIPGLIPNTFYNFFKINVLYSDINETYSSINNAFNTMGSPTSAGLLYPIINNTTLSFYPPLYPPDYYIITNPPNASYIIYASDMSYINNVYSCKIDNISSVKNVNISSYYGILNKTIPVNILTNIYSVTDTKTIESIKTDSTGQYIKQTQNPNTTNYYSSDYGNTWSTTPFSNTTYSVSSSSTDGIIIITSSADDGLYISKDRGNTKNYLLSSYVNGLKSAIISGNGRYIYAFTDTKIYSYVIPVEKGSAYELSVSNIKDKSVSFSFLQPSFIPDVSYDIIVRNHYIPLDVHVYKTSQNQNCILDGLIPNALYDISLNTNYSKEIQTFSTSLTTPFNTLSAPINLTIVGNPTDASAIIQFIEPIIKPDYYILQINDSSYSIPHTGFSEVNKKGSDIGYNLQPNDISVNAYTIQQLAINNNYRVTLNSVYNNNSYSFISNDISFNTRGYPSDAIFTNIYDTSVNLSFTLPKNTSDVSGYTIRLTNNNNNNASTYITNTNNTIIYELSANAIYSIRLSTTYLRPLQTLNNIDFTNVLYTKGGPTIDVSYLSITDTSAIIQIVNRPSSIINNNSLFSKYELGINNKYTDITKVFSSDISYVVVSDLSQNTNNIITIRTSYTDMSSTFISNPIYVPTQGYPDNIRSDYNYITDTTAKITFDHAYNRPPDGYTVKIYSSKTAANPVTKIDGLKYNYYNITGLNSSNNYYAVVGSKYSDTKIFYSNEKEKYQFDMARPPTDVSYVSTSITDTSVNIFFKTAGLSPLKYTLTVRRLDTNLVTNIYDIASSAITTTTNPYTLTNLPKNQNLSITFQSVYPNTTLPAINIPIFATVGPPRNINLVYNAITDSSAVFTYNLPLNNDNTISYIANLKNITNNTTRSIMDITSPYELQDLSSNSTYELYLQVKYMNGVVSNSNIIGFSTQGMVSSIQTSNIKDIQSTVSYQVCPSTPTSYDLTISGEIVSINRTYLNIPNPYTVTDLSKNSIYDLKISSNYDSSWNVLF